MSVIQYSKIVDTVKEMCINSAHRLPSDILDRIKDACRTETFPRAKTILGHIVKNANIAASANIPLCQDTGTAVFFVKWGEDLKIDGGTLYSAINEGTRRGYIEGYLRGSIVSDPLFDRLNTGDNTPATIHVEIIKGWDLEITLMLKGGGCENMSALSMLKPSDGLSGVMKFVRDTVANSGGNPCPPLIVGVGIGGSADVASILAKKALLRPTGVHHLDERYAKLERDLKNNINATGIGPQGLGGLNTTLWVSIEYMPCHIASMPVAVNIGCHSARRSTIVLLGK